MPIVNLDPDAVLAALDQLDEEERAAVESALNANAKPVPDPKPAVEPVPDPKPAVEPAKPTDEGRVAWSLVDDYVTDFCTTLNDADKETLRAAAGSDPMKYKTLAKAQHARYVAMAKPAAGESQEDAAARLAREVFDGGKPGGDAATVQKPAKPGPEERLAAAVKTNDSRGVMQGLVDTINEKGLLGKGTRVVID